MIVRVKSLLKTCLPLMVETAATMANGWWQLRLAGHAADRVPGTTDGVVHTRRSRMTRALRIVPIGMLCALSVSWGTPANAQANSLYRKSAPMREVVQLPQFCWSRYLKDLQTREYQIPGGCGPFMNHYCDDLLEWVRTRQIVKQGGSHAMPRLKAAHQRAAANLDMIKKYPKCPVRQQAEATLSEIEAMIMARGSQGKTADR